MAKPKYIEIKPAVGPAKRDVAKCKECGYSAPMAQVLENHCRCPRCDTYFRMHPRDRIASLVDEGTFTEYAAAVESANPLEFPGYEGKLEKARRASGETEGVVCGFARIERQSCGIAVMDPFFMMGSMGYAVGERIAELFDHATEQKLPVVVFTASGGARMQEGLVSLMQMAKVSCAVRRHRDAGLFYLSVITDPTTGGVTASFATEGDVILAEPKALIGFAGRRVIESTVREELPEDFQTAEFALQHGLIDGIVAREDMREVVSELLALHRVPTLEEENTLAGEVSYSGARDGRRSEDFVRKSREEQNKRRNKNPLRLLSGALRRGAHTAESLADVVDTQENQYRAASTPRRMDSAEEERRAKAEEHARMVGADLTAWEHVQLARRTDRPTAHVYLEQLVDGFLQMHGDRCFADDPAIVGGLGFIDGHPVTVITQEKGTDTASRIKHNFGCSHPEGYRKALRLAREAEHFGRPVICLVDTQGAHCDAGAEERGQGNALAECLTEFAGLKVPVISVILSEGGSGGALALAVADRVAMLENAIYSILTPEGFASILWKDANRAVEAASAMKLTAAEVKDMGIIDAVIPETGEGAHDQVQAAVDAVCDYVRASLAELEDVAVDELVATRQKRFSNIGL